MVECMDWLNYHHLLYFWVTAREGTVSTAAEVLHLSRTTVTGQIRELEEALKHKLFRREGRHLVLTEMGQIVFNYAEVIFATGQELQDVLRRGNQGRSIRFVVGIPDVVPKLIAYRLLEPALQLDQNLHLVCYEGKLEDLLGDLAMHRLDLVLSDSPSSPSFDVRAYNHELGECSVSFFGTPELVKQYEKTFPECLAEAPLLVPTPKTASRRTLDQWMHERELSPNIVAEVEDSALTKVFGQSGLGIFSAPSVIETEVQRQYRVKLMGRLEEVRERYFAISVEKRIRHPAVLAISQSARSTLFT